MSRSFDIACRTCNVSSGIFDVNWGDNDLADLCAKRDAIAAVGSLPYVGRDAGYLSFLSEFFRAHAGHDVLPQDEYSVWMDRCRDRHTCPTCKTEKPCALPPKHDGPHVPET